MRYLFLTGATGLVGRYLLRNLLAADVPVAAMVRPGKGPATLEGIVGYWEDHLGRVLPRPVVVQGDLCHEQVVPSAEHRDWLAGNCDRILHCAASMTFREDRHGEPFRTNIEGTRRLLALCQAAGIRRWHQVSTAYICGLRQGKVLETDIDLGQELGNVYEKSKLEAEKLVRGAEFLDERTFYRPASVVGDSQTGYVTSFHGFYLPLQLAHVMAGRIPVRQMNERFFSKLGLQGHEGKNLVPVDWLAEAIVYLVLHEEHHGKTYHLASPNPVPVAEVQRIVRDAIERYYPKPLAQTISDEELAQYEAAFYEYMLIYQSHWRDDPKFDLTNTQAALPHLPCPDLDYDALLRVARYPVERNFIAARHESPPAEFDVNAHLRSWLPAGHERRTASTPVGLQVNGPGGGQWRLDVEGSRVAAAGWGLPATSEACYYLTASTFRSLVRRELSVQQSINAGRLVVDAPPTRLPHWVGVFEQLLSAPLGVGATEHAMN